MSKNIVVTGLKVKRTSVDEKKVVITLSASPEDLIGSDGNGLGEILSSLTNHTIADHEVSLSILGKDKTS